MVDVERPQHGVVRDNELVKVKVKRPERGPAELGYGMGFSRSDDVVIGLILLQHRPHGPHVIFSEPPITMGAHITQRHVVRQSKFDPGSRVRDLPGDKLKTTKRRLVIEQNPVYGEQVIRLPVDAGDVLCVKFLRCIRGGWRHRGGLGEQRAPVRGISKDFRTGRLVETGSRA